MKYYIHRLPNRKLKWAEDDEKKAKKTHLNKDELANFLDVDGGNYLDHKNYRKHRDLAEILQKELHPWNVRNILFDISQKGGLHRL